MKTSPTVIAQRRLRNESGRILRQAQRGQRFVVTVDGRPVATVGPAEGEVFVPVARVRDALARTPVDRAFRRDAMKRPVRRGKAFDPWSN